VLKKIPPESFDMVFIDPPYFLQLKRKKLKRWKSKTQVKGVFEEWDSFSSFEEYDRFIESLLLEVKRVMKPNATLWVMGTYHNIFRVGKIMQDYTFNREYAKSFGIDKIGANVWILPICSRKERLPHPTQKPLELLKRIILTSTKEGDLILDPMAGTGTTGCAAKMLKRDFVLIEKDPQYVQIIKERLSYCS
jgi:DNA modification methylase